jgi:hypothetical protein
VHDPILNSAAVRENANSLAAALGIEMEEASELLNARVLITMQGENNNASLLAEQLRRLLERTFRLVTSEISDDGPAIEVVVGDAKPRSKAQTVWVATTKDEARISRTVPEEITIAELHAAIALVVACYAAGAVVVLTARDALASPYPEPLILDLKALGDPRQLDRPIDLEVSYLAGAGAIGNGVLWALRYFNVHGRLEIVDFDKVKDGNLQRQIWFEPADIGHPKAERLSDRAQRFFPNLSLIPRVSRLQDLPEKKVHKRWLRRLLVAVDSRRVRRSLQEELPEEVFDASTTDIREIVLHYSKQPTSLACMGCIYPADFSESARAKHVAEALGVLIEDVEQHQITASAAEQIISRYPDRGLTVESLVGEAYDSLFKSLCAQAAIATPEGRQVFAPFAFVSVLAGTLLVIDLVRRLNGEELQSNYWTVSPWFPFFSRLRRKIGALPGCEVCSVPVIQAVNEELWGGSNPGRASVRLKQSCP